MSDLTISSSKFDPANISANTKAVNEAIVKKLNAEPTWYQVGAPKYRAARVNGEGGGAFPPVEYSPDALDIEIPSREKGRNIPCRLMYPAARKGAEDRKKIEGGVVCHFHGGGWVIGDHKSQDKLLQFMADTGDSVVISVGYRLAPEYPYPAPVDDSVDVAVYLAENAEREYGGPLRVMGGESAGAHLAVVSAFHLLKTKPDFNLSGLLLHFGCYDLLGTPSRLHFNRRLVLDTEGIYEFQNAFMPNASASELRNPLASPLYEDFKQFQGKLPPALFTIGTEDPLVDDSVFMAAKWTMAGGEAVLKVYEGAPHGFFLFPIQSAKEGLQDTAAFIKNVLRK